VRSSRFHCDNLPNLVKKARAQNSSPLTELVLKACFFAPLSPETPASSERRSVVKAPLARTGGQSCFLGPVSTCAANCNATASRCTCDLDLRGQVADFVQKNRPPIRRFKTPQAPLCRTGEGAFLVTEELGSNQRCHARSARFDRLWMARAINSFPVPVSPRIRTVESEDATLETWRRTLLSASEEPTISSNIESRSICSRNARFSLRVLSSAWTRASASGLTVYGAEYPPRLLLCDLSR
jgi:hypothetical protein